MGFSNSGVGLSSIFTVFIFTLLVINPSSSVKVCKPASCDDPGLGLGLVPEVRFPFRLRDKQNERCGYPGFDLYCNNYNQTILSLPHSGEFVVHWINYSTQAIYINDDSCLSTRILNFSVEGSAFRAGSDNNYNYFNCSVDTAYSNRWAVPLLCSGNYNYTILVTPPNRYSSREMPPTCRLMPTVSIPLQLIQFAPYSANYIEEDLKLIWNEPACQFCYQKGMYCGFKSDTGLDIGCAKSPRPGLPRGAKYGIILGVGIPGLVCLCGLVCFVVGKFRYFQCRILDTGSSSAAALNPPPSVTISGLDAPTIESYPKRVIGESCRLPEQCDGFCPICLAEYQPKETLRSIPECNHYFHASCLDEWLKLNGTCPLCRNSPESNSVTPCTSTSSAFSTSLSSLDHQGGFS